MFSDCLPILFRIQQLCIESHLHISTFHPPVWPAHIYIPAGSKASLLLYTFSQCISSNHQGRIDGHDGYHFLELLAYLPSCWLPLPLFLILMAGLELECWGTWKGPKMACIQQVFVVLVCMVELECGCPCCCVTVRLLPSSEPGADACGRAMRLSE